MNMIRIKYSYFGWSSIWMIMSMEFHNEIFIIVIPVVPIEFNVTTI